MADIKICRDCRWWRRSLTMMPADRCTIMMRHEASDVDLITGEVDMQSKSCIYMRSDIPGDDFCGLAGRFFEPRFRLFSFLKGLFQ